MGQDELTPSSNLYRNKILAKFYARLQIWTRARRESAVGARLQALGGFSDCPQCRPGVTLAADAGCVEPLGGRAQQTPDMNPGALCGAADFRSLDWRLVA